MAWALRSKGLVHRVRDGKGKKAPVLVVGLQDWVPFEHLPPGTPPVGDGDFEVRQIRQDEAAELAKNRVVFERPPPPPPKETRAAVEAKGLLSPRDLAQLRQTLAQIERALGHLDARVGALEGSVFTEQQPKAEAPAEPQPEPSSASAEEPKAEAPAEPAADESKAHGKRKGRH